MGFNRLKGKNSDSTHKNVWLVNLGREHDDTEQLAQRLESKYRYKVERPNLFETNFAQMDFSNLAAVDLKDCRGWQGNMDFFSKQLKILQTKIAETGRDIPIINPPQVFDWIASKEYMNELKDDIPIVPTHMIHRGDSFPDIFEMLRKNPHKKIVLKPAKGSRAADVLFITQKDLEGASFDITCPNPLADGPKPHVMSVTRSVLETYLEGYKERLFISQHQPAILIQGYNPANEISAVYINSKAHYIERSRDTHDVAHEDFGGKNILVRHPDPMVVKLAEKIRRSLPAYLKEAPYLRIDMFYDGVNPPSLVEIEAGSARLFLLEAKRVDDYAAMIDERAKKTQRNASWAESTRDRAEGLAITL